MALKPMTVNTNQAARLLRQPIGSGFLCYRSGENDIGVVEFVVKEDGRLFCVEDNTPLTYTCKNGKVITYRIVSEDKDG